MLTQPTHLLTLNFHGLGAPPAHVPADEHDYWLPVERFTSLLDFVAAETCVQITFDDGNDSDYELALPELLDRNLSAQFFLLAGRVGSPGYLDESRIRELSDAGMGLGLHGMHHRPWPKCDDSVLDLEIPEARRRLESITGRPITRAACPFGLYDRRSLRFLRSESFEVVYTSDRGLTRPKDWLQGRNTLLRSHGIEHVRSWLDQSPTGLRQWKSRLLTTAKRLR